MDEETEEQRRQEEQQRQEEERMQEDNRRREAEAQAQRDREELERQEREYEEDERRRGNDKTSTLEQMHDFTGSNSFDEQFAINRLKTVNGLYNEISLTSRFFSHFVPNSWTHAGRVRNAVEMSQRMLEREINGNDLGEHTNDANMSSREKILSDYKKNYANCHQRYNQLNGFQKFMGAILPNSWTEAGRIRLDERMNDMFLRQKTAAFSNGQLRQIKQMEAAKIDKPQEHTKPTRQEALKEYKKMNVLINGKNRQEVNNQLKQVEEKGWVNIDTNKMDETTKEAGSDFEQVSVEEFLDLDNEIKQPNDQKKTNEKTDLSELDKFKETTVDTQQVLPEEDLEEVQGKNGGDEKEAEKHRDFHEKEEILDTEEKEETRETMASENEFEDSAEEMDGDESYKESDQTHQLWDDLQTDLNSGPNSSREMFEEQNAMDLSKDLEVENTMQN